MFLNTTTKTRMIINLVISQIGFLVISIVAILSDHTVGAIIAVNIAFALIVTYTNYTAMKRIVGGIERVREYMDDLMSFVFYRRNRVRKAKYIKNDDIGMILRTLNGYTDQFTEMRNQDMHVLGEVVIALNKVSQGIYTTRIHSESSNFMIHALKKVVNDMLETTDNNMIELVKIVQEYTDQDYRNQMVINPVLKGKMLLTMQRINQLGQELNNNARQNLKNGEMLEYNSTTMNHSVETLANKANEQAASLEETAAAVEEITSITKNNTQNASKMSSLSEVVKKSVLDGERLSKKTAVSMDEINDQVTAISEAIIVIDQIAFQTNILSLNAAVEAATAGESGKGFAVVAQEVRNLASRSAQAAKEIKDIVENATVKTQEGRVVSNEMSEGYDNLNKLISQTIELIQNVSTSSKEQLTGIEQINDAISMIDRVTQDNASEANKVSDIAQKTLEMANILVQDAKSKKV